LPIYEFECTRCPSRFELRRSFSDDTPVTCPQCGSEAERIFIPVPVIFKGSGFYSTDNRGNHGHSSVPDEKNEKDETKAASTEESS